MATDEDFYYRDEWPKMSNGSSFDGKQLLNLVRSGNSPFHGAWDVKLLIREVEEVLGTQVLDIPNVSKGSNSYVSLSTILLAFVQTQAKTRLRTHRGFTFGFQIDQT